MTWLESAQVLGGFVSLSDDWDGLGALNNGAALVEIETTDDDDDGYVRVCSPTDPYAKGALLDGGGVANNFTAMAVDWMTHTIYAIRRDLADTQDQLVTMFPPSDNTARPRSRIMPPQRA